MDKTGQKGLENVELRSYVLQNGLVVPYMGVTGLASAGEASR